MITNFLWALQDIEMTVTFICNLIIFLGGFYVVLHSRTMPTWATTSLWYIGLASLLTCITIAVDWVWGPEFPMSYTKIGKLGDLLQLFALTGTVMLVFSQTVFADYVNRSKRLNKKSNFEI